ncbi:uncharacterized protein C9orf43 homolog [Aotus nancymaae]|uniref:uncharacterized protein C9orf43 homolog n=1 Tax=Aotus nancymaae TaxID=37293 RepID=UPI0030FE0620
MDLPDESQWDETTCGSAVCQHPQCWATIRRIERGHPRILSSPYKTPPDAEDKLPVLTVVNIPDSCFAPRHLPECTFTKTRSLLSQSSKFYSKFQGRPPKGLPDKSLINCANRLLKLPVLNLNETQLPCPERNMVVLWIPEETEIHVSQHGKKKKNLAVKSKSFLGLSGNQSTETRVGTPEMIVPPPTPVQLSEKFRSDFLPLCTQSEALPQDLLKELFPGRKQTMPCPEMKIQLAMMRKNLPLKMNLPDSAISSKMFLSIHRRTLEKPALRYPERLKKLHNLKTEGYRKQQQWQQQQQQQRRVKTPTKKQEAKVKAKGDPGSQGTSHKHPVTTVHDHLYDYRTLPGGNSDMKQQQQLLETEGTTSKQDSTERPKTDYYDRVDLYHSVKSPELYETEPTNKDISALVEAMPEAQAASQKKVSLSFSESIARTSWNSELKLLRILQDTDDEDDKSQSSGTE